METTIEVKELCKSYDHRIAVENINLSICRGEVFGLLGANGAGKSTTIECVLGTKKQDSGTVSILGMNPQKERKKLFEKVGIQFQEANYQDKIRVAELFLSSKGIWTFGQAEKPCGRAIGGSETATFHSTCFNSRPRGCVFG